MAKRLTVRSVGCLLLLTAAFGCSESGNAAQAYSTLMLCVAGKGATAGPAERLQALRLLLLSYPNNTDGKPESWPGHCASHANLLYKSLDGSGEQAPLKRSMQSKLGCSEEKPACVINHETALIVVGEMADAAKVAGLQVTEIPGLKLPEPTVSPKLTLADWQPLHKDAAGLVGPEMAADGHVYFLQKTKGERTRPLGCTVTATEGLICTPSSDKIPPLPAQSVSLVTDDKELITTGLTEEGLAGFDIKTGNSVIVKGMPNNLLRDGVAVERGEADQGYVAIPLGQGKAQKPIELKSKVAIEQPRSLGQQVVWLERGEPSRLVVKAKKGQRLVDEASLEGKFLGTLRVCRSGGTTTVFTYGEPSGQRGAKPTAGSDKTQLTATFRTDGKWSKPTEIELPFRRAIESGIVCREKSASLTWAETKESEVVIGQVVCTAEGCKIESSTLSNIDSRWWWSVGPVGDKVLVMWRSGLGEARMRLGTLGQLATTPDVVLFDDEVHGGPKVGEAAIAFMPEMALVFFKQAPPSLLGISSDGTAKLLVAK